VLGLAADAGLCRVQVRADGLWWLTVTLEAAVPGRATRVISRDFLPLPVAELAKVAEEIESILST